MSKSQILTNLTNDVEDLLGKLGSDLSPDVRDLRDRLGKGIAETRKSAARVGAQASSAVRNYAVVADDYIHDSPWIALGTAAAAAGVIGFLAGSLFASNRRGWRL
ncbi:MAG: DUF883 domain-containing protein [Gammaproteobacteria bacterium]